MRFLFAKNKDLENRIRFLAGKILIERNRREMIKLLRHIEDTLALQVDEGRDWLRKAPGNCQNSFDPGVSEWDNL